MPQFLNGFTYIVSMSLQIISIISFFPIHTACMYIILHVRIKLAQCTFMLQLSQINVETMSEEFPRKTEN